MRLLARAELVKEIKSLNEFKGVHWASKKNKSHWRERKEWATWLRADTGLGLPKPHGNRTRKVVITRCLGPRQRRFDDENLLGGSVKALCDALRDLGWLKDDTPKWRILEVNEKRNDELEVDPSVRTVVEIFELEVLR
jgi:hypothetical protein